MQAALVIKTANGYAVVPSNVESLQAVNFSELVVATSLGNSYSSGATVLDALRDTFEKPEAA